jgi:PAS domain S-box-containing protein
LAVATALQRLLGLVRAPLGIRAGIIVFGLAVIALFVALLGAEILREYERSLERTTATSQNLAAVLEHHTTQAIEVVDDGLGYVIDHLESIRGSPRFDARLGAMLRRAAMDMSFVHRIVVADETGHIIQDSLERPIAENIAAESFFISPRDYGSAGIYISAPFKSPHNGRWSIALSRRLNATAREFAGVIVAFVDLGYFQRVYDTLNIGEDGLIQLFRRDGTTLIREPFRGEIYKQNAEDMAAFRSLMQWTRNGTTTVALPPDGIERIISYRTVPARPLVVAVGLSRAEVLAQWRADLRMRAILALVIITAVALLMLLLLRSLARREATEAALRESQQRFELAVRGTSDGLWDWDMVADRVWFSPRCCELLGYRSVDEFSADYDDYFNRIHSEDAERRAKALERHLKEDKPYDVEYRLRLKGGGYRWFRVRGQAIRNAAGQPIRMAGSISDIDAHRAAEAQLVETLEILRENEARLSSLIENVPGVIYRSVFEGRWTETFVNHGLGELTGYPASDFAAGGARSLSSIMHPEDREFVQHSIEEAVRERRAFAVEYRLTHKSGATKWVWDRGRASYGEDGRVLYIDGCIFDITDRRQGEAELRRAKETAEAANQAKSQFLAHMSHELRTPLNAIIGFSEVMQAELFGSMGSPQYRAYARDIHESGTHLLGLINDILDLSKVEAGRQELHEEDCDIEEIVTESLRLVAERAAVQGVDTDRHLQPGLPALRADYRMIKQILLNLLSNAVKFTPAGGTVRLSIATTGDGCLRFQVQDNGIGIPSDQVRRVLEPFVQVEGAFSRKYGGTGLGLPLTRTFVELHGGTLDLSSAIGAGTTVTVTFPKERSRGRASAA